MLRRERLVKEEQVVLFFFNLKNERSVERAWTACSSAALLLLVTLLGCRCATLVFVCNFPIFFKNLEKSTTKLRL